jgi:hypothetical protein
MPNNGYLRVSQDQFITLPKRLSEEPWNQVDTAPYESSHDQLRTPILPLLKLRILRNAAGLVKVVSLPSDGLSLLDARWDSGQRRLVRRIEDAEESDDPKLREAASRIRPLFLLGDGLGQTQLSFQEEVAHGEKQVALARNKESSIPNTPSIAEDVATLGLEANILEIEKQTKDFDAGLKQVSPDSPKTSRYSRLKLATSAVVNALNAAHDELTTQIEEASSAETKSKLTKLLETLQSLIPAAPITKKEIKEEPPKNQ